MYGGQNRKTVIISIKTSKKNKGSYKYKVSFNLLLFRNLKSRMLDTVEAKYDPFSIKLVVLR